MSGPEQTAPEPEPLKRRSTFYVALDADSPRAPHMSPSRLPKSASCDADKSLAAHPLAQSKTAPNVPLLARREASEASGKVHSLTRMFEAPSEPRKVERARSFKAIERLQSRLVGKREPARKEAAKPKEQPEPEPRRRARREEGPVGERGQPRVMAPTSGPKQPSGRGGAAGLVSLVRRTHSTRLMRSPAGASLARSGRHASVDNCSQVALAKEEEADSGHEVDAEGMHSGDCLSNCASRFRIMRHAQAAAVR